MKVSKQQYDTIGKQYMENINPTKKYASFPTLLSLSGDIENKKVLDLACGDGYFTRQLAALHPRKIIGVDISSEMIKLAIEIEKNNPQEIEYIQDDARVLGLHETFDVVTAVYLLDYAATIDELQAMIQSIYNHLNNDGIFATITINPTTKPRKEYIRGWKIRNPKGNASFSDGDSIEIISEPVNNQSITINCYYWSQKTYTSCLEQAGFKDIIWKYDFEISDEGKVAFDKKFWNETNRTTSLVGIRCKKQQ